MGLRPLAAHQPRALRQAADDRRPDPLDRDPGAADPGPLVRQRRLLRRPQRRRGPRPVALRGPGRRPPPADPDGRGAGGSTIPGPGGPLPSRLYVPPLPAPEAAGAAARLLPRRRLGDRRPRHVRRGLPAARRGLRLQGPLGRLPARPRASFPRSRSKTPSRPSSGRSRTPRRSASTRSGSASAATRRAATWPRWSATWRVDGGGAVPAMQLLFYPVTDSVEDTRSRQLFSEGFILTKADMEKFEAAYLPPGVDAVRPADLDPPVPRPARPADRLRRHRRLRPAARRGRGLRAADARLRRPRRPAPPPRPDPHLRQPDRGQPRPRSARCSRRPAPCGSASPPTRSRPRPAPTASARSASCSSKRASGSSSWSPSSSRRRAIR